MMIYQQAGSKAASEHSSCASSTSSTPTPTPGSKTNVSSTPISSIPSPGYKASGHCVICDRSVKYPLLWDHLANHMRYRPYKCVHCGIQLVNHAHLEAHAHAKGHVPVKAEFLPLAASSQLVQLFYDLIGSQKKATSDDRQEVLYDRLLDYLRESLAPVTSDVSFVLAKVIARFGLKKSFRFAPAIKSAPPTQTEASPGNAGDEVFSTGPQQESDGSLDEKEKPGQPPCRRGTMLYWKRRYEALQKRIRVKPVKRSLHQDTPDESSSKLVRLEGEATLEGPAPAVPIVSAASVLAAVSAVSTSPVVEPVSSNGVTTISPAAYLEESGTQSSEPAMEVTPKKAFVKPDLTSSMDGQTTVYACGVCGFRSNRNRAAITHLIKNHGVTKRNSAAHGGGGGVMQYTIQGCGDLKFSCILCTESVRLEKLNIHANKHLHEDTGLTLYRCLKCTDGFPSSIDVREHLRKEHQIRNGIQNRSFKCDYECVEKGLDYQLRCFGEMIAPRPAGFAAATSFPPNNLNRFVVKKRRFGLVRRKKVPRVQRGIQRKRKPTKDKTASYETAVENKASKPTEETSEQVGEELALPVELVASQRNTPSANSSAGSIVTRRSSVLLKTPVQSKDDSPEKSTPSSVELGVMAAVAPPSSHSKKYLICQLCHQSCYCIRLKTHAAQHMKNDSGILMYNCAQCKREFASVLDARVHITKLHGKVDPKAYVVSTEQRHRAKFNEFMHLCFPTFRQGQIVDAQAGQPIATASAIASAEASEALSDFSTPVQPASPTPSMRLVAARRKQMISSSGLQSASFTMVRGKRKSMESAPSTPVSESGSVSGSALHMPCNTCGASVERRARVQHTWKHLSVQGINSFSCALCNKSFYQSCIVHRHLYNDHSMPSRATRQANIISREEANMGQFRAMYAHCFNVYSPSHRVQQQLRQRQASRAASDESAVDTPAKTVEQVVPIPSHTGSGDGSGPLSCLICGKMIKSLKFHVWTHLWTTAGIRRYRCPLCVAQSNNFKVTKAHLVKVHRADPTKYRLFSQLGIYLDKFKAQYMACYGRTFFYPQKKAAHIADRPGTSAMLQNHNVAPKPKLVAAKSVSQATVRLSKQPITAQQHQHLANHSAAKTAKQPALVSQHCRLCGMKVQELYRIRRYHVWKHLHSDDNLSQYGCTICHSFFVSHRAAQRHVALVHKDSRKTSSMVVVCLRGKYQSEYNAKWFKCFGQAPPAAHGRTPQAPPAHCNAPAPKRIQTLAEEIWNESAMEDGYSAGASPSLADPVDPANDYDVDGGGIVIKTEFLDVIDDDVANNNISDANVNEGGDFTASNDGSFELPTPNASESVGDRVQLQLICKLCSEAIEPGQNPVEHVWKHLPNPSNPIRCSQPHCDYVCSSSARAKEHMLRVHGGQSSFGQSSAEWNNLQLEGLDVGNNALDSIDEIYSKCFG